MSRSLLRSTGVVSAMTFLSRILGFVRDIVYAQVFGAGTGTDAFFVAFRIPNLMRRLFAEGAFSLAFVPVFSQYRSQRTDQELRYLVDHVAGTLGLILFGVTLLGVVGAPILIVIIAPGFTADAEQYDLTITMLRITFPYLMFISLTAFAGGILNSCGRFAVPALTPVLLNVCMIAAALWLAPQMDRPVIALAWGVFAAGAAQLLFQLPFLYRLGLLPRPRWGWRTEGVQRILKLMLPTLLGSSAAQINLLVNTLLASFLVTGSVSWLYYSDRLVEFPLGVFGVALGTVILPTLSRKYATSASDEFSRTLDWGLRWVLLIGLPAAVALNILAIPLLSTLFQHGAFTAEDVVMSSRSLMAYALGLLAFMLVKVLAPGFYARQDTATPVKIAVGSLVANMILSLALIGPLQHAGLALAAALASYINAGLLLLILYRQGIYRPSGGWWLFTGQILIANLAMGAVLWYGRGDLSGDWLQAASYDRLLHLSGLIGAGLASYGIMALLIGVRPRHLRL